MLLNSNQPINERADTAAKSALSLPVTNMKLPARELMPRVSEFCLDERQDIWDCCEVNKLPFIYPTVGNVEHSKIRPATIRYSLTDSVWSLSYNSPILTVRWWSPNLSILRTSTYIETHISRMYQLAGHSWKIFRGVLCYRVVGKRWQSYYYWFYQRNPAVKKLLTPTNNLAPRWSMEMAAHRVDVESGVMQLSQLTSR